MKPFKFILLLLTTSALTAKGEGSNNNFPCMNIPHTEEVISCMINLAESKKAAYIKEYNLYMERINTTEERPYNKVLISKLAQDAKKNWDAYTEKECLAEASIYEEGDYSFNDTYNSCLIDHYNGRIEYYKNHKF